MIKALFPSVNCAAPQTLRTKLSLGPELKFDPAAEHFIDNDDARAMESRDYRGEFTVPDAADV